jgi:hypothetical protein
MKILYSTKYRFLCLILIMAFQSARYFHKSGFADQEQKLWCEITQYMSVRHSNLMLPEMTQQWFWDRLACSSRTIHQR